MTSESKGKNFSSHVVAAAKNLVKNDKSFKCKINSHRDLCFLRISSTAALLSERKQNKFFPFMRKGTPKKLRERVQHPGREKLESIVEGNGTKRAREEKFGAGKEFSFH